MNRKLKRVWILTLLLILCLCIRIPGTAQPASRDDSVAISLAWFEQGNFFLVKREWDPALLAYRKALQYSSGETFRAKIHQNLGSLHFLLSDYQKAAIHFEYAFQLLDRNLSELEQLAEICLNLGFTYIERSNPELALHWFGLANKYQPSGSFLWHVRIALGIGNVHFSAGEYLAAIGRYRKALSLCSSSMAISEEEVWILKNMAWCFQAVGDVDSALLILDTALDRITQSVNIDSFSILEVLLQKSILLSFSGQHQEALQVLDSVFNQVNKEHSLPSGFKGTSDRLRTIDVMRYRILAERIRIKMRLRGSLNSDVMKSRMYFEEIPPVLQLGDKLAENSSLIEVIATDPEIQRSLTGIALNLLLLMDGDTVQKVLEMVNLMRRLSLFEDLCFTGQDYSFGRLQDSLSANIHNIKNQLYKLHRQRFLEGSSILIPDSGLIEARVLTLDKLYTLDPGPGDKTKGSGRNRLNNLDSQTNHVNSRIRCNLNQNEALLKYLLCDSTLFTILFTADTSIIRTKDVGNKLISDINGFIKALKILDPPDFFRFSARLYHYLIEPVEEFLVNIESLHVIPDKHFEALPFDALIPPDENQSQLPVRYMIHRFETVYYTSLSSWYNMHSINAMKTGNHCYKYDFGTCIPEFSANNTIFLPYAKQEVEEISRLFRSRNRKTKILTGNNVSPDGILELASQSRIVHLATHGHRDQDHPEFSGWLMRGDPQPSPDICDRENRMEIGALQGLDLKSDLLVLSSCSVGLESGRNWYRITNFPFNFFRAGINHMIFSLWDVSDKHTNMLMDSFYRNYLNGNSYSSALRFAKLQMLSSPETSFPTIWAVFVLWSD